MTGNSFDGMTGLRKQIIANCYFIATSPGQISIIVTHEPIGTYKAIALRESRGHRDVVLSSDGNGTVPKALEQLLTKSADAVQQFITTNGFSRMPADVDNDDDGVSSVSSSYLDEAEKDRMADSSITLESELESAYESPSEDGEGSIADWTGGSYDTRTVRRDSRSRSRSHSRIRDCAPLGRKVPPPPARDAPVHSDQANRSRAAYPQEPYGPFVNSRGDGLPANYPMHPLSVPPPMMGRPPRGTWAEHAGVLSDRRLGPESRGAHWQRALEQAHRNHPGQGFVNLDNGKMGGPQVPLPPPTVTMPSRSGVGFEQMPWPQAFHYSGGGAGMPGPHVPPMPQVLPMPQMQPMGAMGVHPGHRGFGVGCEQRSGKAGGNPNAAPIAASSASSAASSIASSIASSSASSTPTVTTNPTTPPQYSPGPSPAKIDYRLVIKAFGPSTIDGRTGQRVAARVMHEHRMVARTAPTRAEMRLLAAQTVMANMGTFRSAGMVCEAPANLRISVARAVFGDESYDLAAYGEDDFSRLCEVMRKGASGSADVKAGAAAAAGGWPLFEVTVEEGGSNNAALRDYQMQLVSAGRAEWLGNGGFRRID